ncbi:hypothetical protein EV127DRAFT_499112 [Xylaria flabelliformis]|nr:hypothetical protein EV127DRAFT_499112 [Xylaria flabelliformis]
MASTKVIVLSPGEKTRKHEYRADCMRVGGPVFEGDEDFSIPVENVDFINSKELTVCHEPGCSVVTAAVSGLAGLLLCCDRVMRNVYRNKPRFVRTAFRVMQPGQREH